MIFSISDLKLIFSQGFIDENHSRKDDLITCLSPLKIAGYGSTKILIIAQKLQLGEVLPTHFHIINNRILLVPEHGAFNIDTGEEADLSEPKAIALTIWIPHHGEYSSPNEKLRDYLLGTGQGIGVLNTTK